MTSVYFNDNEPYVAQWLRNLYPESFVDERSISDITPSVFEGYERVHLFAGIGGWQYALDLAGWTGPVWTGSCPCQPFSVAGEKGGLRDERHLWPEMYRLIRECHPDTIFGEQVAAAIGYGWLDDVFTDLEAEGYTCGSAVLGAHSIGAPHVRQRLYWVAHSSSTRRQGSLKQQRFPRCTFETQPRSSHDFTVAQRAMAGDPTAIRPDNGLSVGVGRSRIKGYGNAIVPQVAAQFIAAFMEAVG